MTNESKVALQTIWEELLQEHVKKVVVKFAKCLTAYTWFWLPMMLTPRICSSNSVHLQTSPTHQLLQRTIGEDNAQNAEKWGLLG